MGRLKKLAGMESEEKFVPIQADADLFSELREEIPEEPMVQLQPRKDNPGLQNGMELVKSLYHHRKNAAGKNISPVNSFEIWFDDGEVRFYFHPDTREQKNSGMKHFEDKYPGTRMQEEGNPFPQINEGDYIAGGRMTLTHDFVRPLRMPEGPSAFSRDPFGDLTSDMVVEGERTSTGERVRSEDVRMVVQVLFQPASRKTSRGGLFGTDFNDYADELKKPTEKSGWEQTARMVFGLEPKMRDPTAKMKKTAKVVSELRGEPEFFFRLRVICISPYREMAKQHVERVCEVFETYYNPVTEQGLQPLPYQDEMLRDMLKKVAGREMCYSTIAKLFSGKDLLSVPELAGLVHLPNESIETPEVNWTNMQKGSGVPTTTPDLNEVDETLHEERQKEERGSEEDESDDEVSRMRTFGEEDAQEPGADVFDLEIEMNDDPDGVIDQSSESTRVPADGRGLETDEILQGRTPDESTPDSGESVRESESPSRKSEVQQSNQSREMPEETTTMKDSSPESEERQDESEDDSSGIFSGLLSGSDDDSESEQDRKEEDEVETFGDLVDEDKESIERDWEAELQAQHGGNEPDAPTENEKTTQGLHSTIEKEPTLDTEEASDDQEEKSDEPDTTSTNSATTQDELPDEILEELDG
jgi:hypothetical protein